MICVVGLQQNEAIGRLQSVGVHALIVDYSSKKGVECADTKRVIRQTESSGIVYLVCSDFRSVPEDHLYENLE